jgi:predicted ATP-dependent Lon-type protease
MIAQTYSNVVFDVLYSWLDVEKLSEKLDTWRQNLPSNLLLVSLLSQDHEVHLADRRSLLMVHMLHLQARLIAYQRKIQQSGVGEALRMPTSAFEAYMAFARQLSRIIAFLFRDGHYMKFWLVPCGIMPQRLSEHYQLILS